MIGQCSKFWDRLFFVFVNDIRSTYMSIELGSDSNYRQYLKVVDSILDLCKKIFVILLLIQSF